MPRRLVVLLAVAVVGLGVVGCSGADPAGARMATERFYSALARDDGARACRELGRPTIEALEEEEKSPCPKAILDAGLDTAGARPRDVQAGMDAAEVRLASGDSVFLELSGERWEISAAGCQAKREQEPYDCDLED